jgi:hypothetical protein
MIPENMLLSETATLILSLTIVVLLIGLLVLKIKANKKKF